jgi:hypothetical protein
MTVLTTTLNLLLGADACVNGYNKLAMHLDGVEFFEQDRHYKVQNRDKNAPINLMDIIKSNGAADAIWCLRACQQDSSDVSVKFAQFCAWEAKMSAARADAAVNVANANANAAAAHAHAAARAADDAAAAYRAVDRAAAAHAARAAYANAARAAAAHAADCAVAVAAARERQAEFLRSVLSY